MRPTRACLALVAASLAALVLGRSFATLELYLLAAVGAVAIAIAAVYTLSVHLDLQISRRASPARLRAGAPARIDLDLHNSSRRPTPVLRVVDHIGGSATGARVSLAGIRGRRRAVVAYQLPTRTRGVLEVGPLDLTFGDPLGLVTSTVRAASRSELLVHPTLLPLQPLQGRVGHDQAGDTFSDRSLRIGGDEFFALRPYVVGDELRRVNWRATARTDDLMVRTDEQPRTTRSVVVLDRSAAAYTPEGFERAVSVTISALRATWQAGEIVRLVTTGPAESVEIHTPFDLDLADDRFATLTWSNTARTSTLQAALTEVDGRARGGILVVVTGVPGQDLAIAMARLGRRFRRIVTITCEPSASADLPGHVRHDGSSDPVRGWAEVVHGFDRLGAGASG